MSTLSRHLVWLRLTGSTQVRLHSLSQTRDKSKCWPLLPRGHKEPKHIEATEVEIINLYMKLLSTGEMRANKRYL